MLQKLKDGRLWKKESRSTQTGYKTVRYRNCPGSFTCSKTKFVFFLQCNTKTDWCIGSARKCTAFISDKKPRVLYYGNRSCDAKLASTGPANLVQKAASADPDTRPAKIQRSAILSNLRSKNGQEKMKKTVKKVTNIRNISNKSKKESTTINANFGSNA